MWWEFSVSAQVYCQKDRGEREIEADRETEQTARVEDMHTWTDTHRNTLLQEPISEISKKGLGSDWVDSWAVITYESNSPQIRTVSCLTATLLPSPSLWQCQPMSQVLKSTVVQAGNTKISQSSDRSRSLLLTHLLILLSRKLKLVLLLWP